MENQRIKIRIKKDRPIHYEDDCKRIQNILLEKGFDATLIECQDLWRLHSEDWNANWLVLNSCSDKIFEYIEKYIDYNEKE